MLGKHKRAAVEDPKKTLHETFFVSPSPILTSYWTCDCLKWETTWDENNERTQGKEGKKKSLLEPFTNHNGKKEGEKKKEILLEPLFTTTKGEKGKEKKLAWTFT